MKNYSMKGGSHRAEKSHKMPMMMMYHASLQEALSVRWFVRPFVRSLVRPLVMLSSKSVKNGLLRILERWKEQGGE